MVRVAVPDMLPEVKASSAPLLGVVLVERDVPVRLSRLSEHRLLFRLRHLPEHEVAKVTKVFKRREDVQGKLFVETGAAAAVLGEQTQLRQLDQVGIDPSELFQIFAAKEITPRGGKGVGEGGVQPFYAQGERAEVVTAGEDVASVVAAQRPGKVELAEVRERVASALAHGVGQRQVHVLVNFDGGDGACK